MLKLFTDNRLGGNPRYYIAEQPDHHMIVHDDIRKCAVFVAYKKADDSYSIRGTAFMVSVPDEGGAKPFGYIVTAKHIIAKMSMRGHDKVYLRINTRDGFEWLETRITDWRPHPDDYRVDVSVFPVLFQFDMFDFRAIRVSMSATEDVIKKHLFGVGDEVFLTGLFTEHSGKKKNLPIVRTGAIALMPEEPIEVKIMGARMEIDAYLIEARSIGGLSGSPVFVHTGAARPFVTQEKELQPYYWLGLMHGHWEVDIKPDDIDEDDTSVPPQERVNMGIAIVVPVEKILEVINQPHFAEQRKLVSAALRDKHLPTPDDAGDIDDAENAFTEEDFEEVLRKVSRKDKPKGE